MDYFNCSTAYHRTTLFKHFRSMRIIKSASLNVNVVTFVAYSVHCTCNECSVKNLSTTLNNRIEWWPDVVLAKFFQKVWQMCWTIPIDLVLSITLLSVMLELILCNIYFSCLFKCSVCKSMGMLHPWQALVVTHMLHLIVLLLFLTKVTPFATADWQLQCCSSCVLLLCTPEDLVPVITNLSQSPSLMES